MKFKRFIALLLALCMVAAIALTGCGSSSDDTSEAGTDTAEDSTDADSTGTAPETLEVGTSESLGMLLPYTTSSECGTGEFLIYDMLFYYNYDQELVSDIITDYYYSDDGFTLYLVMSQDVVFSNGDLATGEDLLFSLSSIVDEERGASTTSFDYFDFENSYVEDDGYTVVLKTYDTATAVSQFCNLVQVALLDKAWVEEVGWDAEEWYTGPVGSGPYIVSDYVSEHHYTFTKRDDYWGGDLDMPETITVTSYSEATTMAMDLENGDLQLVIEPDSTDYEAALEDDTDNIDGISINGNTCNWIVFDCDGIFADENLRLAVAHACDWDQVAAAGKGVKYASATSSIPSYFSDYKEEGQYEYDPDLAIEYLNAAGYEADGSLVITMYVGPQDGSKATATIMQEYLRQVGITLEWESYEMATVMQMWTDGDGDLFSYAYQGGSVTYDSFFVYQQLTSSATMELCQTTYDSTIDDCVAAAILASTEEEAREYYQEIQDWIYETCRVVSYFEEVNCAIFDNTVITDCYFTSKVYPDLRNVIWAQ